MIQASDHLTPREHQVAQLVAAGLTRKKIAEQLTIAIKTVDSHMLSISGKLPGTGRLSIRITRFVLSPLST